MRSYRFFAIGSTVLLVIYLVANLNKPQPYDWHISLKKQDKNPFGAYIVYEQLKNIFPKASIESFREPVYNRLQNKFEKSTAYVLIAPKLMLSELDINELLDFTSNGNSVLLSANDYSNILLDTLGISLSSGTLLNQSSRKIQLVAKSVKDTSWYEMSGPIQQDAYFDSLKRNNYTFILGVNENMQPNFIKIKMGEGWIYVHANPTVFSNYFLLHKNNAKYTQSALSFLPENTTAVFWDEYEKTGRDGAQTPLRFFLENYSLRWALWLGVVGLILFVLFNGKRTQRIIPIISPLTNTSVAFVQTIANLYYNQKDNNSIARKRFLFWLEYVRNKFYISTELLNETFIATLSKKSGVDKALIQSIIQSAQAIDQSKISNTLLLQITKQIDDFYKQTK